MDKEITCPRCNGIGYISSYKHIEDGICFLCEGKGTVTQHEYEQYITAQVRSDKNRTKRNAKRAAELKATAEKVDKQREERLKRKNQPKPKVKPKEPEPYNDDAEKAINKFLEWCEKG